MQARNLQLQLCIQTTSQAGNVGNAGSSSKGSDWVAVKEDFGRYILALSTCGTTMGETYWCNIEKYPLSL